MEFRTKRTLAKCFFQRQPIAHSHFFAVLFIFLDLVMDILFDSFMNDPNCFYTSFSFEHQHRQLRFSWFKRSSDNGPHSLSKIPVLASYFSLIDFLCSHWYIYLHINFIFIIKSLVVNVERTDIYLPKSNMMGNLSFVVDEIQNQLETGL